MTTRFLIIGAGVGGRDVVRAIRDEGREDIEVLGFLDDDPAKQGSSVEGVTVLGAVDEVAEAAGSLGATHVLISAPSVGSDIVRKVAGLLPSGFPIKVLPSVSSVLLGKVDLSYVRDIDPSDLIGRPMVKADQQIIAAACAGKTFLVTGAAGSIGSEIVRQLYDSSAKRVVLLDSWEEGMFNMLEELGTQVREGRPELVAYLANVRDVERMQEVFDKETIDVVLHAAAYKHVPLMEDHPEEARKTNTEGTENVLKAAHAHGVPDFVLVSTDKAVNPTSVMGKTKRDAELLVKRYAKEAAGRYIAVRFGNVLNSSGSIVPKFLRQIRSREALTITDLAMTRYFMSIPEAVSLVLRAWMVGENGQVLVLDMGEPVKILDLAQNLIRMHGLTPGVDIEILEIGIRPGEKIHEELAYETDKLHPSPAERIFIAEEL